MDESGQAYVTGYTRSSDFDATAGAYQTRNGGGSDGFASRLCMGGLSARLSGSGDFQQSLCLRDSLTPIRYTTCYVRGVRASRLPPGTSLNFSGDTLTIFGTLSAAGTFNYTLEFTLRSGATFLLGGTITVSIACPSSLAVGVAAPFWRVYPNPTDGSFVIEGAPGNRMELLNTWGQVLRAYELVGPELRVVEDLLAGLYLLREVGSGQSVRLSVVR